MNDDLPLKASVKAGEAISGPQKPAKQMSGLQCKANVRLKFNGLFAVADPDILLAVPAGAKICQKREIHQVDKYGEKLKTTMSASLGQKETLENSAMIYDAQMDIKYAKDNAQMDIKYAKK